MTVPVFLPEPATAAQSQLRAFRARAEEHYGRAIPDYASLHALALEDPPTFWRLWLESSGVPYSGDTARVIEGDSIEHARFFPHVLLNFAESALQGDPASIAISSYDESGLRGRLTRAELAAAVGSMAATLQELGVGPGDRVVGIVRNTTEAVIACLGAAAIGAAWASVPMDLGVEAILKRFEQIRPVVLVAHGSTTVQGVRKDLRERLTQVIAGCESLQALISLDGEVPDGTTLPVARFGSDAPRHVPVFAHFPFNQPLFILFSSGTTGAPKCIVHGAGGTLVEHTKEHRLHCDLRPGARLYFHTSTGWMMWNWQLSALVTGCEIVLYDGSVSYPEADSLLRLVDEAGITHFGTSPAYLQYLRDAGIVPRDRYAFSRLTTIMSTGSILADALYDWVDAEFKRVPLQSISGGTDIIGCFVLGNPELPVFRGESQCTSLGYDVRVMTPEGPLRTGRGELICCAPFPSRPVGFFDDPAGARFHEAYFVQHPPYWTHGDMIELSPRGTARVLGRSDGTLNIRGVRIGPAEVTSVVEAMNEVRQAMVIEQRAPREPGGSRMVLLVVLQDGRILDRPLQLRIKRELATRASANHVPAVIADVRELPVTFSGKLSERAARDAANGVAAANASALRNPACLEEIANHPSVRFAQPG